MREGRTLMVRCRCGRENSPFTPTCACGQRVVEERTHATRALRAGDTVGRWVLGAQLGKGSVGTVFSARAPGEREVVAIKVLHEHLALSDELRVRFGREARALSQVDHRHVGRIREVVDVRGTTALVLEAYQGRSLRAHLGGGVATARARAVTWLHQLCQAVGALHERGWLHRDIKPENVFLAGEDIDRAEVRLLDFGLVRALTVDAATFATGAGSFVGSPAYAAPEQLIGADVSPATDWWSVGVVGFELLTGRRPFAATSRSGMATAVLRAPAPAAELDAVLDGWLETLLRKDPRARPASTEAVLAPLSRWLQAA
jgi:serine/threonine-protein kinase